MVDVLVVVVDNCLVATANEEEYGIGRRAACAARRTIERVDDMVVGILLVRVTSRCD